MEQLPRMSSHSAIRHAGQKAASQPIHQAREETRLEDDAGFRQQMPRAPIPEQSQEVPRQRPRQFWRGLQALGERVEPLHGSLLVLAGPRAQPINQFDQPAVVG
jgi:hypothetical protein